MLGGALVLPFCHNIHGRPKVLSYMPPEWILPTRRTLLQRHEICLDQKAQHHRHLMGNLLDGKLVSIDVSGPVRDNEDGEEMGWV